MMKLGAAWYGFGEQTPSNYFEMVAALGLKYAEVPVYAFVLLGQDAANRRPWFTSRRAIEEIRGLAADAGIRVASGVSGCNIAGRLQGNEVDRFGVGLGTELARYAIEVSASLGLEVLRLAEPGRLDASQAPIAKQYMQAYGQAFHALGDYAGEHGVRLAIENFGLTSTQINQVLDAADHPMVGTLYDPCNYYRHGEDPLTALKNLGQRVYYCHLKDAYFPYPARTPDSLPMASSGQMQPWWWIRPVGEGNVDWGPILSELATYYDGYMCLEHDPRGEVMWGTRRGIEYVRRIAAERKIDVEV